MEEANSPRYIMLTNKVKAALVTLLATPPFAVGAETFARTGRALESLVVGLTVASAYAIPIAAYYVNNYLHGQHQPIIYASAGSR